MKLFVTVKPGAKIDCFERVDETHFRLPRFRFSILRGLLITFVILVAACGCASQIHSARGHNLIDESRYDQAIAEFEKALETDELPGTYLGLHRAYLGKQNYPTAKRYLLEGLQRFPEDGHLMLDAGLYYAYVENSYDKGIEFMLMAKKVFKTSDMQKLIDEDILTIQKLKAASENGIRQIYRDDGTLEMELNVRDSKLDGWSKFYRENGKLQSEKLFDKGDLVKEKAYLESGEFRFEGLYKDGKFFGTNKWYFKNGNVERIANFKNGKYDGPSKIFYESGALKKEWNYKGGEYDGISRRFYESGNLKDETGYENGKVAGEGKRYYKNGRLMAEITLKNGLPDGAKTYYANGSLMASVTFDSKGNEKSMIRYYETGEISDKRTYKNGKLVGKTISYYPTGETLMRCLIVAADAAPSCEVFTKTGHLADSKLEISNADGRLLGQFECLNGKLHGVSKTFYLSGNLETEAQFKNGKKEGTARGYYESGKIQLEETYEDGKPVGQSRFYDEDGKFIERDAKAIMKS